VTLPDTGILRQWGLHRDRAAGQRGAPPYTYLWNTGSTDPNLRVGPGQHALVHVRDFNGCDGMGETTIATWTPPSYTVNSLPSVRGIAGSFSPRSRGHASLSLPLVQWDTTRTISIDHAAEKCLEVWDAHGCYGGSVCGEVTMQPELVFYLSGAEFCVHDSGRLEVNYSSDTNAIFIWDGRDTVNGLWVHDTALHRIQAVDTVTGCTARDSVQAIVHSIPRATSARIRSVRVHRSAISAFSAPTRAAFTIPGSTGSIPPGAS